MVSVFSPSSHDADAPFSTSVSPFRISTVAYSSVGVAVTLFVAFSVVAVYSYTDALKAGVSVNAPIASPDKDVTLLPLHRRWRWRLPDRSR